MASLLWYVVAGFFLSLSKKYARTSDYLSWICLAFGRGDEEDMSWNGPRPEGRPALLYEGEGCMAGERRLLLHLPGEGRRRGRRSPSALPPPPFEEERTLCWQQRERSASYNTAGNETLIAYEIWPWLENIAAQKERGEKPMMALHYWPVNSQ